MSEILVIESMFVNKYVMQCSLTLSKACLEENLDLVKKIVNLLGKNVSKHIESDGTTPLMIACQTKNKEIVKYLLKNGSDCNHSSKSGRTALHVAASTGNVEIIKMLYHHGAIYQTSDKCKNTPLLMASIKEKEMAITMLEVLYLNEITPQEQIDSAEILASSFLEKGNFEKALLCYQRAFFLRDNFQLPKFQVPICQDYVLFNYRESISFEKITSLITESESTQYYEAILTKCRILGKYHPETQACYNRTILYYIYYSEDYINTIKFILIVLDLYQSIDSIKSIHLFGAYCIILTELFTLVKKNNLPYQDFEEDMTIFIKIISDSIIDYQIKTDGLDPAIYTVDLFSRICALYLYSIELYTIFKQEFTKENQYIIYNCVINVFKANISIGKHKQNLIQLSCSNLDEIEIIIFHPSTVSYFEIFPSIKLIDYLFDCCDDNVLYYKDERGNNLLFYALEHCNSYELCSMLVKKGFHTDAINKKGKQAIDMIDSLSRPNTSKLLRNQSLNLACLCAIKLIKMNCNIMDANIPYSCKEFINMH
jgi:Ankyrin repeats (3 copies)